MDNGYAKGVLLERFCEIALPEYIKADPTRSPITIADKTLSTAIALTDRLLEYAIEEDEKGGNQ